MSKPEELSLALVRTQQTFRACFPLLQSLLAEEGAGLVPLISVEKGLSSWQKARKTGFRLYKAKQGKTIVGVMGLTEINDPLDSKKAFRINDFIVVPAYRRQGIGTWMMGEAKRMAKKENARFLVWEVALTNKKAEKFYKNVFGKLSRYIRFVKAL